jgi:D-3-phosphoglycerate dehydrogenase / 2-oxoglutarate reductase
MYKIHCLNNISKSGLEVLPSTYDFTDEIKDAHAILVRSAKMHDIELENNVLAVARAGSGVNNIPLDDYAKKGVVVFNTPGANANAVKELTIAGMFLAARHIKAGMNWMDDNKTDPDIQKNIEKAKKQFAGTEVLNKTIGIIGLGAIGLMLANTCAKLGMKVLGTKRNLDTLKNLEFHDNITLVKTKEEIYQKADYISLNIPLSEHTKHIIDQKAFKQMKDGVILLNFARDQLVNDDDLKTFIDNEKVRAYVTDFPNPKTAQMDGVIAIPHLGASSEEAEENCAIMASTQVRNYLEHGSIKNSVNYPEIRLDKKESKHRLSILCRLKNDQKDDHIKDLLTKLEHITRVYQSFNVHYGIVIIDTDQDISDHLLKLINDLDFVTRVRML